MILPDPNKKSRSEIVFSGPVTRDKFRAWYTLRSGATIPEGASAQKDFFKFADWQFQQLAESPIILRDFFSLTEYLRGIVVKYVNVDNPIQQVAAFVTVAKQLQKEHPRFDFVGILSIKVKSYLMNMKTSPIEDFHSQLLEWYDVYRKDSSVDLSSGIPLMLSILYGDDVVSEAMQRWLASDAPGEVLDFVEIVRSWETLKQYPIEWAVSVVQDSSKDDE